MSAAAILIGAGIIHCALTFFNVIFVTCAHYPYLCFLRNTGLEIGFLQLKWCTTVFNHKLDKWSLSRSVFWPIWFDLGILTYLLILPVSVFVILKMTFNLIFATKESADNSVTLEPMIPGVDLPLDQLGYYIITLLLCTIVHEMGHAMAAVKEGVKLFDIGMSLKFIVPIAFVNISSENLTSLPTKKQLRVLCAGVWHNVALAFMAFGILNLATTLLQPFYTQDSGVIVLDMTKYSPLLGQTGLNKMDIINKIDDCPVNNGINWHDCILKSVRNPHLGYCIESSLIKDEVIKTKADVNSIPNCCSAQQENDGFLCFKSNENLSEKLNWRHVCFPARKMIEHKKKYCSNNKDCGDLENSLCFKPSLQNSTKIVEIQRKEGKNVLFVGHPADIYRTVTISDWIPKFWLFKPDWPDEILIFSKYTIIFSSGLIVVNTLPCFFFDGQHVLIIVLKHFSRFISDDTKIQFLASCTSTVFTVLLVINLTVTFVNKIF